MQAGRLNESITIEQPVRVENDLGEVEECCYAEKYKTRAEVRYKSGTRTTEYAIETAYAVIFIIRDYHSVTETDTVLYRGRRYRIEAIEWDRAYHLIKLNCSQVNG